MNFRRVMVILNIDLKVPGDEVGHKIGNPTNAEADSDSKPQAQIAQSAQSVPQQQSNIN